MDTDLVTKEKGRCVYYGHGGQPYGWLMAGVFNRVGRVAAGWAWRHCDSQVAEPVYKERCAGAEALILSMLALKVGLRHKHGTLVATNEISFYITMITFCSTHLFHSFPI